MKNAREQNHPAVEGWLVTEVKINVITDDISVSTEIYRSRGNQMSALREAIGDAYDLRHSYMKEGIDQNDREATIYAVMNERDPASNTYTLNMGAFNYIWKLDTRMIQVD